MSNQRLLIVCLHVFISKYNFIAQHSAAIINARYIRIGIFSDANYVVDLRTGDDHNVDAATSSIGLIVSGDIVLIYGINYNVISCQRAPQNCLAFHAEPIINLYRFLNREYNDR